MGFNAGIKEREQDPVFNMPVKATDDGAGVFVGVPPFLIVSRPGGDLVDCYLVAVGFLIQLVVVEVVESSQAFLPVDGFLSCGGFRQVKCKFVERFVLLDTGLGGCDTADVALNVNQAALNAGGRPAGFDRC